MKTLHALVAVLCMAGAAASAQTSDAQDRAPAAADTASSAGRIGAHTKDGITYQCGGVDDEEQHALKQASANYDLMLTFATSTGAYMADVKVALDDAQGHPVLNLTCDGPILLVRLPKHGAYRVRATAGEKGITRMAQVRTSGKLQSVLMSWPANAVDMGPGPQSATGSDSAK